ncbi:MAG TPA: uroporphyrinogen decarboxylase family protein, partial [Polyangiaceae bacterium]|nr:uroporphyrinogen decarboxylase family protein [Polyangiaceae bacterium]
LLVKGQVEAYRYYGHDFINVGPGLTGIAEAFGAKVIIPAASTPYVAGPAIEQLTDVGSLKLPVPESTARLPMFLDAAELALRQVGDEVLVTMTLGGPFTTACNIFGTERLLRELRRNGPLVHQLLRVATDAVVRFAKAAIARGARIGLADPTASGSVIGLKVFESFALPYLAEVVRAITKASGGVAPSLHVCGRTQAIWRQLADTGASGLSLDDVVDLGDAKATVGNRVALIGNIRPTATMYLGTPEDVRANAKECLAKAHDNPKGFILGMGCGLPVNAPKANVRALVDAAREYGQYPLDPARFAA